MLDTPVLTIWLWMSSGIAFVLLIVVAWLWMVASRRAHASSLANRFLSLSQQRLQYALEGSNLALWDYDVARGEIYFSNQMGVILGKQAAPRVMARAEYHALIHPEDFAAVNASLTAAINDTASSYRASYRVCALDGSWKWLTSYGKVVEKDAQGNALRMTGTISDNTELHRAQEKSRLLARAVEESVDGIMIADATQTDVPIVYCNSAIEDITGYSRDELLGRNCRFLQGEDRGQQALETIRNAQTSGNAATSLLRNYRKDGSLFWNELSISPVHDEKGRLTHYIGIAHDVTARVKAEEALLHENEFSSAAINALPGTFFVLNRNGETLRLNNNMEKFTGYSAAELANMRPQDLCAVEDRNLITAKINECVQKGSAQCEAHLLTKDGRLLPFYFQGQLYVLGGEECIVGTGTDISNLKRIQQELIHSQSLLNTIVEHIPAMVFLKRAGDLSYVLLNKVGEEILEYTRDEVLDKTDMELFSREQAAAMTAVDRDVLANNQMRVLPETMFTSRSGWKRYLYTIKTVLCDEEGVATHLLGISIDISERKQAERKLRDSEQRLKEAQAIAHLGHWSLDLVNHKLQWSDEIFRIFGREQGTYIPSYDNFVAAIHPEDVELFKNSEQRALGGGRAHRLDHRIVRPDGEVRWVHEEAKVIRGPAGKPMRLTGTVQDITARKVIEQAVMHSEARLRTILDTAVDSIIIIDSKGIIESANPAAEKLFGYTIGELIGRNVSMLMPEPDRSAHDGYLRKYQETGKAQIIGVGRETHALRKDGSIFPIELAVSETWFEDRRMFTGFVRDISYRKEAEEQLLLAKEQAEQASRAKSEFLSNMSHELRTPMNAILGFAQLLDAAKPPLSSDQKQDVMEILHAGQHLLSLINELLDLARIEAGRMQISLEPVAIRAVVNECVLMIEPLLLKHNVSFEGIHGAKTDKFVMADRNRLRQVLLNLLSNAVKYNRTGGEVSIACKDLHNGRVRIEVKDSGIGIAQDKHAELFESFSRLDADEGLTEGTGIGLAITRRLVELMNGEVGVESLEGQGSVFWVELPVADEDQQEDRADAKAPVLAHIDQLTGYTILYIEDNPANVRFMSNLIGRRSNLRLLTASRPTEGLLLAETQRPDLILLDIHLPEMDGFELFSRLQASEKTRHIPVIAVSANAMPTDVNRALKAGFKDYCTKPIDINQFMQTIDRILKQDERDEVM